MSERERERERDNNPFRTIEVNNGDTIKNIKKIIKEEEKINNNQERLIFVYKNPKSQIDDEILESLRQTLEVIHQSESITQDIIVELNDQGYKIEKMQRDIHTVGENNKKAEMHLRSIKHFFGRIFNKFLTHPSSHPLPPLEHSPKPTTTPITPTTPTTTQRSWLVKEEVLPTARQVLVVKDEFRLRIEEQDKYLDQIGCVLGRIHEMALNINTELDEQNLRLNQLNDEVDNQQHLTQKNTNEIKKLLK